MCHDMNTNYRRGFLLLGILCVVMNATTGVIHLPTRIFRNYSELFNRTTMSPSWKRSNSIEILKRLIANRQILSKSNRTLFLPNMTSRMTFIPLSSTTTSNTSFSPITPINSLLLTLSTPPIRSSNNTTLAIIVVCCFTAFFFLTLIFTLLRRSIATTYLKLPCTRSLSTSKQSRNSTPLSYSPIDTRFATPEEFSIDQLYDIYMQKHALDDLAFSIEFKTIPDYSELQCLSATRSTVASKNRFLNILPLDATRVTLRVLNNNPATDYINGNYISGYKYPKKFIATQGPKADTCEDFWRMIWELKLQSIVMLTNTIEGTLRMTKCHQYWPELHQTITYGDYQITCIDQENFRDYEKRFFQLNQITNDKEEFSPSSSLTTDDTSSLNSLDNEQSSIRLIVQYHYTQWKDMDVPNDSHTLLHLIDEVNEQTKPEQYPIVVHCTAGVGRTGTYIAIDAMMEKIKQEGKIDVYHFVSHMRRERHLMVQTVKQYVFIYRTLLEYYLYGNTRIEGNLFQSIYSNFKKNKHALLLEYNKLTLLPAENISHRDAHSPDNIQKNRHTQIVPYDHNRVWLSRILGHPYINASLIKGYSAERSFILTQDPLEETIPEFWRMFIEHNCNCIVQLHTIVEPSPSCARYYPNEIDRIMKISSTSLLKLLRKEIIEDRYILRQFYLTDTRETLSKTIDHYEYLIPISTNDQYENEEECIPMILTHSLFDFIGRIQNQNQPMTIHCGNGGPTCSIFTMIVILLDQLKTEHAVDIFQSVRALQRQRPAMITSYIQYEYLYEMIYKFLEDSFDLTPDRSSLSLNNSIYDNDQSNVDSLVTTSIE